MLTVASGSIPSSRSTVHQGAVLSGTVPLPVSEMVNVSLSVMVRSTLLAAPMPTLALVAVVVAELGVSATVKVSSPSIRPSLKVGRLKLKLPLKVWG